MFETTTNYNFPKFLNELKESQLGIMESVKVEKSTKISIQLDDSSSIDMIEEINISGKPIGIDIILIDHVNLDRNKLTTLSSGKYSFDNTKNQLLWIKLIKQYPIQLSDGIRFFINNQK